MLSGMSTLANAYDARGDGAVDEPGASSVQKGCKETYIGAVETLC